MLLGSDDDQYALHDDHDHLYNQTRMAARAGYTALTPETTVFPPRFIPAPGSEAIQPAATTNSSYHASFVDTFRDVLHGYWMRLRGFVDNNAGLLLVALAQLFFAFVNVSGKVLKEIDIPMPTLEVLTCPLLS